MAQSLSERQANWRARQLMRAEFFLDLDKARIDKLQQSWPNSDKRPEVIAVRDYFMRYPRCVTAPIGITFENGMWVVEFDYYSFSPYEAAAAKLALFEVSSLPVRLDAAGDGKSGVGDLTWALAKVQTEVAEMRRLNIWGVA